MDGPQTLSSSPEPRAGSTDRLADLTHHIRSITMLLSLITPYPEDVFIPPPGSPYERKHLRLLDRAATLFNIDHEQPGSTCLVGKTTIGQRVVNELVGRELVERNGVGEDEKEGTARARWFHESSDELAAEGGGGGESVGRHDIYVFSSETDSGFFRRNRPESESDEKQGKVEHDHVPECFTKEGWMDCYLRHGPYSIHAHTRLLEVLGNAHLRKTEIEKRRDLMINLTYFALLQYQPKIMQRLDIKLHANSSTSFLDMFRLESDGGMNEEELRDGWLELPQYAATKTNFNEGKLKAIWKKCGVLEDFELTEDGNILLTRDTIVKFHRFISRLVCNYHGMIKELGKYRIPSPPAEPDDKGGGDKDKEDEEIKRKKVELESLLAEIHLYIRALIDLSTKSPAFARYINQRPIKRYISVRATESRPGLLFIPKNLRDHLQDEEILPRQGTVLSSPQTCLQNYITSLTFPALAILESVLVLRFPMYIHLLQFPADPIDDFYQSTLCELLTKVLEGRENDHVRVVMERIGTRAEYIAQRRSREEAENQGKWRRPEMLVKESWALWPKGFKGGWHPISLITCAKAIDARGGGGAGEMQGMGKNTHHLIGTSKKCCYTCNLYLTLCSPPLQPPVPASQPTTKSSSYRSPWKITGCSGRFIPWSPPPFETRVEILEAIWEHLKAVLIRHLGELYLLPSADDSDGSALEASDDEGGGVGDEGGGVGFEVVVVVEGDDEKDGEVGGGKEEDELGEVSGLGI